MSVGEIFFLLQEQKEKFSDDLRCSMHAKIETCSTPHPNEHRVSAARQIVKFILFELY